MKDDLAVVGIVIITVCAIVFGPKDQVGSVVTHAFSVLGGLTGGYMYAANKAKTKKVKEHDQNA